MTTGPEHVEVGTSLPSLVVRLDRASLVRYAGASGDFNPIHFSERSARALGLPNVIAHGMLTMGTAVRVVTDWAGPGATLLSYGVRFTKPVVVPDDGAGVELHVGATVTAVDESRVSLAITVTCDGEKVLGAAKAEIDLSPR